MKEIDENEDGIHTRGVVVNMNEDDSLAPGKEIIASPSDGTLAAFVLVDSNCN